MTSPIITPRLVLRPIEPDDVAPMAAALNNIEVSRWLARVPHPFAPEDVRLVKADGAPLWPEMAVIARGKRAIGAVRSGATMGFWIARAHWGKGYMSEAAAAAIQATFERTDLTESSACVFKGNAGSARVLEKLGFVQTNAGACTSMCLARGQMLEQDNYILTRQAWEARG